MQQPFPLLKDESRQVVPERSRWRDLALNDRHRLWGFDCPMIDLDALEYDHGKAVALVEYKNERAKPTKPDDSKLRALCDLGNRAQVPVFGVKYSSDFSRWAATALNPLAAKWLKVPAVNSTAPEMAELEWVRFLYHLRGRSLPQDIERWIRNQTSNAKV